MTITIIVFSCVSVLIFCVILLVFAA